ncbi:MAG: hypothetical protein EOP10_22535 [Proteobacteria bacterium]|nr:MAG: hypothetical protein EOP10_22535 [Pseudomonadota bacterium]
MLVSLGHPRDIRWANSKDRPVTTNRYVLRLYISGKSQMSKDAEVSLRRICAEDLSDEYTIEIIDVMERPQLAEDEKIIATPTLIKQLPPPLRRVIGDLSDRAQVLIGLDLKPNTTVTDSLTRTKKGAEL